MGSAPVPRPRWGLGAAVACALRSTHSLTHSLTHSHTHTHTHTRAYHTLLPVFSCVRYIVSCVRHIFFRVEYAVPCFRHVFPCQVLCVPPGDIMRALQPPCAHTIARKTQHPYRRRIPVKQRTKSEMASANSLLFKLNNQSQNHPSGSQENLQGRSVPQGRRTQTSAATT